MQQGFNPYYYDPDSFGKGMLNNAANAGAAFANSGGNPKAAAVTAAIQSAGNWINASKQAKEYARWNPQMDELQTDAYGRPIYSLGDEASAITAYDPEKAGKDLPAKGAAFGGIGLVAGLFQRKKRRKEARRSRNRAISKFRGAQDEFNTANSDFFSQAAVMRNYNRDRYNQNIFGAPQGIY